MTFLFFGALIVLVLGFSQMNPLALFFAIPAFLYSVHKLDQRQERDNRARMEAQRQENVARGNGKPHGNVQLVARSDDE